MTCLSKKRGRLAQRDLLFFGEKVRGVVMLTKAELKMACGAERNRKVVQDHSNVPCGSMEQESNVSHAKYAGMRNS